MDALSHMDTHTHTHYTNMHAHTHTHWNVQVHQQKKQTAASADIVFLTDLITAQANSDREEKFSREICLQAKVPIRESRI